MEKAFVTDLRLNQQIVSLFLVLRKEIKPKKTGGDYMQVVLGDRTGQITGFLWENIEEFQDEFQSGDYVKVKALVREYNGHLQLTVHKIKKVPEDEVEAAEFLPVSGKDVEVQFAELLEQVEGIQNTHLKTLLQGILADSEIGSRFRRAPAAKRLHHAVIGGLLDHTLSLVRLCRLVAQNYPAIHLDLLLAGAILHDIGKVQELSYQRAFDYTDEGRLLGHIVMEVNFVNQCINQQTDFPEELRIQLLHILVAHHGKLEFGSPKLPMTLEALVLHYLDDLDVKIHTFESLMADETTGDTAWSSYNTALERHVYRRRID